LSNTTFQALNHGEIAMLVKDRMTSNPITALPETTHKQAAEIFREHGIHHLPIVDRSGKLVGIVIEDDLFAAQPSPATTLSIYEIHSLLSKLQLKEIMTHPVYTVEVDCALEEAASLMLKHNIGCLPVMEVDRLVGIITDTDIFQAFVSMLGSDKEGARITLRVPNEPGTLAKLAQAVADASGNIIAITTWQGHNPDDGFITIKEQGADFAELKAFLEPIKVEIIEMRKKSLFDPKQYG
jgi:acetoin utilization protein AcuB